MGSKKRSSWSKQKAEFNASLGGMDNLFVSEGKRQQKNVLKKKQHYARKPASRKSLHEQIGRRSRNYLMCKLWNYRLALLSLPLLQRLAPYL